LVPDYRSTANDKCSRVHHLLKFVIPVLPAKTLGTTTGNRTVPGTGSSNLEFWNETALTCDVRAGRCVGHALVFYEISSSFCKFYISCMNLGSIEDALGQGAMSLTTLFRKATNLLGFGGDDDRMRAPPLDGEIVYCKNNVCVHPPANLSKSASDHFPGYLNIRSQDDEVCFLFSTYSHTRL